MTVGGDRAGAPLACGAAERGAANARGRATTAIRRFLRPVTWQGAPQEVLPDETARSPELARSPGCAGWREQGPLPTVCRADSAGLCRSSGD
jgi:hypothetical protein